MNKNLSEVTVFTVGDSTKPSTWSNLPYFFTEMLLQNGIKVNRVDISPSPLLEKIYNKTVKKIIKLFFPDTTYDYFRSLFNYLITRLKISIETKKYYNSEANIFLTYSFSSAGLSNLPSIQLCDWTYDHYLDYFCQKKPDFFEASCIRREDYQIRNSDMVVTLYSGIKNYLSNRYKNPNTFCFGNIINSFHNPDREELIEYKSKSSELLFVGTKKYHEGTGNLFMAFTGLKKEYPELQLHIIGMENKDFESLPQGISCHGYLDKSKKEDKEKFYSLFKKAKAFINTTPKWGAFSAANEAMHFFTPVIITPFTEFVNTFGSDIDFGYYSRENSPEDLQKNIKMILEDKNYADKCIRANEVVKDFSWSIVMNKFLSKTVELKQENIIDTEDKYEYFPLPQS